VCKVHTYLILNLRSFQFQVFRAKERMDLEFKSEDQQETEKTTEKSESQKTTEKPDGQSWWLLQEKYFLVKFLYKK